MVSVSNSSYFYHHLILIMILRVLLYSSGRKSYRLRKWQFPCAKRRATCTENFGWNSTEKNVKTSGIRGRQLKRTTMVSREYAGKSSIQRA